VAQPEVRLTQAMREKMDAGMAEWKTPYGKKLEIRFVPQTGMCRIAFTDGGELPPDMKGTYTSQHLAAQNIEKYLRRRWTDQMKQVDKQKRSKLKDKAKEPEPSGESA